MASKRRRPSDGAIRESSRRFGATRSLSAFVLCLFALAQTPVASAHGTTATAGLSQWHGVLFVLAGTVFLGGSIVLKRTGRISPTSALSGVFVGIVVTAVGAILFEGLSPDPTFAANSMPFARSWYPLLSASVGLAVVLSSFGIGWTRWPTRPRYTFFGILMGMWIAYPVLVPGPAGDTHPLGYAIVLVTPGFVGYILWKDAGGVLRAVLRDPVARRFGVGIGAVVALFLAAITGYLSVFPEEGVSHETNVVVLPAIYELVLWPTLEVSFPHSPLFVAISPGQLVVIGSLSALVGLNAAFVARHWRIEERAGTTEGTVGAAAVVGSCTCGCCGPLVAKVAVLGAGPSIAAPLYWVFVDPASPLNSLFLVASIVLFTGSLVYSVETARGPDRSVPFVPAD